MTLKGIIEYLKEEAECEVGTHGELDERSWGNQHGIIISVNEAMEILAALNRLQSSEEAKKEPVSIISWKPGPESDIA